MRRTTIEKDGRFEVLLGYTTQKEKALLSDQARTDYEQAIAQWKAANAQAQPPLKPAPRIPAIGSPAMVGQAIFLTVWYIPPSATVLRA